MPTTGPGYQAMGQSSQAVQQMPSGVAMPGASLNSPTPSPLDAIARDIGNANAQIVELTMRTRGIADSVFGTAPETAAPKIPNSQASSKLEAVSAGIAELYDAIIVLRGQINRLSSL